MPFHITGKKYFTIPAAGGQYELKLLGSGMRLAPTLKDGERESGRLVNLRAGRSGQQGLSLTAAVR